MWVAADCLLICPEAILRGLQLREVNSIALSVHWGLRSIPSQWSSATGTSSRPRLHWQPSHYDWGKGWLPRGPLFCWNRGYVRNDCVGECIVSWKQWRQPLMYLWPSPLLPLWTMGV